MIVKPPFQFIQIGIEMLDAQFMIGACYRTFQQTPDIFNAIGMYVLN